MPIYFCNVWRRDYVALFGSGATNGHPGERPFFDLDSVGFQERMFRRIEPCLLEGQECIVATYPPGRTDQVIFETFIYVRFKLLPEQGTKGPDIRVLFGKGKGVKGDRDPRDPMAKAEAAEDPRYKHFFDVLGRFKRPSARCL